MAQDKEERWEPKSWDDLFPGRFLKSAFLGGREVEVQIERVYNTKVDGELAQVVRIHQVAGIDQQDWGLNKTNGLCLRALFGDTIRDWFGKRVVIYEGRVEHGREKGKPCIRICASPEIEKELAVVIDFHTKRIKPFTIRIRPGGAGGKSAPQAASPDARLFAKALRDGIATTAELKHFALQIETALDQERITRDESKALMAHVTKLEKELTEKESANVIS